MLLYKYRCACVSATVSSFAVTDPLLYFLFILVTLIFIQISRLDCYDICYSHHVLSVTTVLSVTQLNVWQIFTCIPNPHHRWSNSNPSCGDLSWSFLDFTATLALFSFCEQAVALPKGCDGLSRHWLDVEIMSLSDRIGGFGLLNIIVVEYESAEAHLKSTFILPSECLKC